MKKINCKKCNKKYDPYLEKCPKCEERNPDFPFNKKFTEMVFLGDLKLLLMFIFGSLLLIGAQFLVNYAVSYVDIAAITRNMIVYLISFLVIFILLLFIINKDITKYLKAFTKLRPVIVGAFAVAIMFGFSKIYQYTLINMGINIADSYSNVIFNNISTTWPIFGFITIVILNPLVDELAHRAGLFSLLYKRSRILAYFVSCIIYTFLHMSFLSPNLTNELLNLPIYLVCSLVTCIAYEREGIAASIYAHALNNLIAFILMFVQK